MFVNKTFYVLIFMHFLFRELQAIADMILLNIHSLKKYLDMIKTS